MNPNPTPDSPDELDRYHRGGCQKFEALRGVYPNDKRKTDKPCSCGLERLIASECRKARLDELGSIQLEYGHYGAQTYINGKWTSVHDRCDELSKDTTKEDV